MSEYSGPLAGTSLAAAPMVTDPDDLDWGACENNFMHVSAIGRTIFTIFAGRRVRLTRRISRATRHEVPGTIEGVVVGMSSGPDHIILGLDTGVGVDVLDPAAWYWEVLDGDS